MQKTLLELALTTSSLLKENKKEVKKEPVTDDEGNVVGTLHAIGMGIFVATTNDGKEEKFDTKKDAIDFLRNPNP